MWHMLFMGLALKQNKTPCTPVSRTFAIFHSYPGEVRRNHGILTLSLSLIVEVHSSLRKSNSEDTSSPRIISGPVSRTTSSGPSFGSHSLNTLSPASLRCHKSQGIHELHRHRLGTFNVSLFGNVLSHFLSENRFWKICRQHLLCAKHCAGLEETD